MSFPLVHTAEELNPSLEPLLLHQVFKQNGVNYLKFGESVVEFSDQFRCVHVVCVVLCVCVLVCVNYLKFGESVVEFSDQFRCVLRVLMCVVCVRVCVVCCRPIDLFAVCALATDTITTFSLRAEAPSHCRSLFLTHQHTPNHTRSQTHTFEQVLHHHSTVQPPLPYSHTHTHS